MNTVFRYLPFLFLLSNFSACSTGDPSDTVVAEKMKDTIIESRYQITIPEDVKLVPLKGPKFTVYYFEKQDRTTYLSFSGGFYFSDAPALVESDNKDCNRTTEMTQLLGKDAEMLMFSCDGKYTLQSIVNTGLSDGQDSLHVFASTTNKKQVNQLKAIFASLRIK